MGVVGVTLGGGALIVGWRLMAAKIVVLVVIETTIAHHPRALGGARAPTAMPRGAMVGRGRRVVGRRGGGKAGLRAGRGCGHGFADHW